MPDYYEILQVHPNAEPSVIRMAYKALCQQYHPDKNGDNPTQAERRMKEINEAFAVLSDLDRRAAYDRERRGGSGNRRDEERRRNEEAEAARRRQEEASRRQRDSAGTSSASNDAVHPSQRQAAEALGLPAIFRNKLRSGGVGPVMVVIPAGAFLMGSSNSEPERSNDEGPQHFVTFSRPFALGRYAVTFDEYDLFCRLTGRHAAEDQGWGRGKRPVIHVIWKDAQAYCQWLSSETGKNYRLPSEAEWEYACRAGTTTLFWWGNTISPK